MGPKVTGKTGMILQVKVGIYQMPTGQAREWQQAQV